MNIFNNISLGVASVGTIVASWLGYAPIKEPINFGASTQSSEVRALFTTTLASKITSSATSMTLSSATDKDGTVLASSTYGFIIDEGTSKEELVLADCTGTTCTNMTRGLSVRTGTTTVAALQFEHGRGAEIKITDAPSLIYASNVFRGKQNLDYKLRYNTAQTFSDPTDIISKDYADSLSFGGVPAASESASGFVELANGVEAASSTSLGGTGARLAIPASLATSTYNSATAALRVVVTQNNGKIDTNFLPSTIVTTSGNNTFTAVNTFSTTTATSTVIGSMPAYWIGKNVQAITTTGTSTFTVPSGINKVHVRLVGAGGGGGSETCSSANESCGASGGGGGGYSEGFIDVTGTTSVQVFVGSGGAGGSNTVGANGGWSTFGTNGFYMYGNGGVGGGANSSDAGSSGGTASGGYLNITGGTSGEGTQVVISSNANFGGLGGSSFFGTNSGMCVSGQSTGYTGTIYGTGGSGGCSSQASGIGNGGVGAQGIIIVTW